VSTRASQAAQRAIGALQRRPSVCECNCFHQAMAPPHFPFVWGGAAMLPVRLLDL